MRYRLCLFSAVVFALGVWLMSSEVVAQVSLQSGVDWLSGAGCYQLRCKEQQAESATLKICAVDEGCVLFEWRNPQAEDEKVLKLVDFIILTDEGEGTWSPIGDADSVLRFRKYRRSVRVEADAGTAECWLSGVGTYDYVAPLYATVPMLRAFVEYLPYANTMLSPGVDYEVEEIFSSGDINYRKIKFLNPDKTIAGIFWVSAKLDKVYRFAGTTGYVIYDKSKSSKR